MKTFVLVMLFAIVASLFSALYFLTRRDEASSKHMLTALKLRVGRVARRVEDVTRTVEIVGTPQPVFPNNTLTTRLDIANTAGSFLFDTVLQLRYPEGLFSTSEGAVSDSGFCAGTSCDEAAVLTWNLGDLNPGQTLDVTLPPVVSNATPEGSLIRYWARLTAGSFGQAASTAAIPVGNNFTDAGPIQLIGLFVDGFESGNTSAWTLTVP